MSIARHVGFEQVVDLLRPVTRDSLAPTSGDRHYYAVSPETMCELVNDSDDEGTGKTVQLDIDEGQ